MNALDMFSRKAGVSIFSVVSKQGLTWNVHRLQSCTVGPALTYCRRKAAIQRQTSLRTYATTFAIEEEVMQSFAKGLFTAKIDMSWIFPFPTFESSKQLNEFNESLKPLQDFLSENIINSFEMDETAEMHPDLIQELKKLKLFGMTISEEYDGLGLSNLKQAKYLEEIGAVDMSVTTMLATHNLLAAQAISNIGTAEQKQKYLREMARGEKIGAFCLNEVNCGSDITPMRTRAVLSEDKSYWTLNGEKTSVTNGAIADLMIVFAKTKVTDVNNIQKDTITAFIVEKQSGGVYCGPQESKMGMRALNTCDVMFDDVIIPADHMLGKVGQGFKIATDTTNYARLGMTVGLIGQSRKLINKATEYTSIRKQFGKRIGEFGLVKEKIFRMSQRTYVMESMAYWTLGKMDEAIHDNKVPDLSVDYAIAKIFCSEEGFNNVNDCINVLGYRGYTKAYPYERFLRDDKMLTLCEGNNDVLRLYIALASLQQVESLLTHRLEQIRVGSMRERLTAFMDQLRDNYGSDLKRKSFLSKRIPSFGLSTQKQTISWLDPYLEDCGLILESTVQKFYRRIYNIVKHFGNSINNEQLHLRRIADVAICMYSMAAVISRCNKSLLLGLRNREHERMLAVTYVFRAAERCEQIMDEFSGNYHADIDNEVKRIGNDFLLECRYPCSHPLELEHRYIEHPKYIEQMEKVEAIPGNTRTGAEKS